VLSAFTHLWNATGFPDLFYDEGIYMRRAMTVLEGQNPQENPYYYDHPLFGQIFLAGLLAVTGYPSSLHPNGSAQSIEELYLVPKIWMGLLAVLDTFLIYKIVEYKYNNTRIALVASTLFAVMPTSWLIRRILLESLLLPFLLSSILLALQLGRARQNQYLSVLLSGVCLGLAVFTKIPVFTMMPLVGFLVYTGSKRNRWRNVGFWLIPVILIPLLWPLDGVYSNSFDNWIKGVFAQTQRLSDGINGSFRTFLDIDPILLVFGIIGFGYAIIKRDLFVLLWLVPFLVFLWLIGYVQYFHVIPLLPVFCISTALWMNDALHRVKLKQLQYLVIASIVVFGLVSTTLLITTNVTSGQFKAIAYILTIADKDTTIIANPVYAWPYKFVFHLPYALNDYRDVLYSPVPSDHVVLVSDAHLRGSINEPRIGEVYNRTSNVRTFYGDAENYGSRYPYTSMPLNYQGNLIDIRQSLP